MDRASVTDPIVVTGTGMISALGTGMGATLESLMASRSGIGSIRYLDTIHRDDFVLGEVDHSMEELLQIASVDESLPWTRTALLGVIAAREALREAGCGVGRSMALISATTVGGMDRSEQHYQSFLTSDDHNEFIDSHHAGNSTEMIALTLGIKGKTTTISTACSSSLNSLMFGARLLQHGLADQVIAGGTDALSRFTFNGFNTLMILDRELCKPFDQRRMGLNLGEGAGYMVLERASDARKRGATIKAQLSGWANANDAFHQTASSDDGEGPFLAMSGALQKAGLSAADIDYINVHGTGTENNDLTEGTAMQRLFGTSMPPFSSTKAFTGHTLGAAGVVESIISVLSLQTQTAFPNLNFKVPMESLPLIPLTRRTPLALRHVLTNSFGFGGNDSSLVFSKWNP